MKKIEAMALCKAISVLASEVEAQLSDLNKYHSKMLATMKKMPEYLARNNLSEWEGDYRSSMATDEDENSKNYQAIDLIYELASVNLYSSYNKKETEKLYKHIITEFSKLGIHVSRELNVSSW